MAPVHRFLKQPRNANAAHSQTGEQQGGIVWFPLVERLAKAADLFCEPEL